MHVNTHIYGLYVHGTRTNKITHTSLYTHNSDTSRSLTYQSELARAVLLYSCTTSVRGSRSAADMYVDVHIYMYVCV